MHTLRDYEDIDKKIKELLNEVLAPARGCTEPIAIALAAARAREEAEGELRQINLTLNASLYRNAARVFIPGTEKYGVEMAVALGYAGGEVEKELEVLESINSENIVAAEELAAADKIDYNINNEIKRLYIDLILKTDTNQVRVIVLDEHTNIEVIEIDEEVGSFELESTEKELIQHEIIKDLDLRKYFSLVNHLKLDDLDIINRGIRLSYQLAHEGIKEIGDIQQDKFDCHKYSAQEDNLLNYPPNLCQAASKARMNGSEKPAMSLAGSGNQGITVFLTLLGVGEVLESDENDIIKALVLAILITTYIKNETGTLSAMCGAAIASAAGAGCGAAYLLGEDIESLWQTVLNIYGTITGLICDGAKPGCAHKVHLSSYTAVNSALKVKEKDFINPAEGILADNLRDLVNNISRLENQMENVDDEVISILKSGI